VSGLDLKPLGEYFVMSLLYHTFRNIMTLKTISMDIARKQETQTRLETTEQKKLIYKINYV